MPKSMLLPCALWLGLALGSSAFAQAEDSTAEPNAATQVTTPSPDNKTLPTPAAPVNPPSDADQVTTAKAAWIPVSYSAAAVHYYGFRGDVDPFTVVELGANWKVDHYTLAISQSLTKYYFVNSGDAEVQAADTVLTANRELSHQYYGFKGSSFFILTLPVSEFSRDQGVITKSRLGAIFSREFFDKTLKYSIGGGFQYNWNRYTSTRTGTGEGGGRPLRHYTYSIDNSASYKLIDKLSADAAISYIQVYYQDIGYRNRQSTASADALLNNNYSIGLGLSYELNEHLSLSGGYSQSDVVEKTGGVREAYLFDAYTTQWYVGLSSSF